MVRHKRMTNYRLNILQQKDECNRYHVHNDNVRYVFGHISLYKEQKGRRGHRVKLQYGTVPHESTYLHSNP
jgi:hypothetical protein